VQQKTGICRHRFFGRSLNETNPSSHTKLCTYAHCHLTNTAVNLMYCIFRRLQSQYICLLYKVRVKDVGKDKKAGKIPWFFLCLYNHLFPYGLANKCL